MSINVEQLSHTFTDGVGQKQIFHNLSLEVARGEVVSIMGPSGCGKSTFLNVVAGILPVQTGRVTAAGVDLTGCDARTRTRYRRDHVSYVAQDYNLVSYLNAHDNIAVPLQISGAKRRKALEQAAEALAAVGLEGRGSERVTRLSGGERQRVAIARSIASGKTILLADEPTGALDASTAHEIMALITRVVRDFSLTGIVVTHDQHVADQCTRIVSFSALSQRVAA